MAYVMRFIQTDNRPVTIDAIETGLKASDSRYRLADGKLSVGDATCAEIDMLARDAPDFTNEIDSLRRLVQKASGRGKKQVSETLDGAQAMVVVNVLWEECEPEETLQKIDPLWAYLFDEHEGLVHADEEGFYERSRCILTVG